jgi:hypothetical protein
MPLLCRLERALYVAERSAAKSDPQATRPSAVTANPRERISWLTRLLYVASAISAAGATVFGAFFWFYYWRWRGLFNEEGRYFHEPDAVVFHEQSAVLLLPAVSGAVVAIVLWIIARAKSRRGV